METVSPKVETSGFIDVFTAVLPFILLVIVAVVVIAIIYIFKMVKQHIANGKASEQRLIMEKEEIQKINERLDRIEKILDDVE